MKVYSKTQPQTYQQENKKLAIRWNEQQVQQETGMNEQTETFWEYNEAIVDVYDTRKVIIQKIIGSVYTHDDEIALINNKEQEPEEYAEYQAFRAKAKELADGWLNGQDS